MGIRRGACLCGQVRFEVSGAPTLTLACHCRGCQRLSASAFSLSEMIPIGDFRLVEGEPVVGALHGPSRYLYCPHCLNWLFTRPEGLDAFIMVRATLFDDCADFAPFIETMTKDKLSWVTTPAVRSFEAFPAPEDFGEALQAFAARGG